MSCTQRNIHHIQDLLLKQEGSSKHNTDIKLDKYTTNNENNLSCVDGFHIIMSVAVIARNSALNIPNIPM